MVEKARLYCSRRQNVHVSVTDGTLGGFAEASLDFVYSYIVFQHIPEVGPIAAYASEAARVLRPGGLFRFQVDGRWQLRREGSETYDGVKLRPSEVLAIVRDAGLLLLDEWGQETHYHSVTAMRPGSGAKARLTTREWDRPLLARILAGLGFSEPEERVARVTAGAASIREECGDLAARWAETADAEFLVAVHRALLGREPDPAMMEREAQLLEQHLEERPALVDSLLAGAAFRNLVRPLDTGVPWYRRETAGGGADELLFSLVDALEAELAPLPDEGFLARAFERVLGRALDEEARGHYAPRLAAGLFERRLVLRQLLTTPDSRPLPPPPSSGRIAELGGEPDGERGCGESFPGEAAVARRFLEESRGLPDEAFVARGYERLLGREADADGLGYYGAKISAGETGRVEFARELLWSDELRQG
jgi:SAM-dependent methyltransferase